MTTYREPVTDGFVHYDECAEGSPDLVLWICEFGHWLAWEIPPAAGDRCPVVNHDANADGRCYGLLSRPGCACVRRWRQHDH